MELLIKNGRLIDPASERDGVFDLLIHGKKIKKIGKSLPEENTDRIIDAAGFWVTPGFIDLHVHLREPGYEYKETIATGSLAAAKGGFTTICCMPNTNPVTDCAEIIFLIKNKAASEGSCNVLPVGAITKGQKGAELAELEEMAAAGVCAFSEDGKTVPNAALMLEALKKAEKLKLPVFSHCEEISLAQGVINEGEAAEKFGFPVITNSSEELIAARDIMLSANAGAKLHLCHISTAGTAEIVREAKKRGFDVSAEVTPHHFTLSDKDIKEDNGNFKMNPPLRSENDKKAIIAALKDGTIEVIATDHAPHAENEKNGGFLEAQNGIIGLETALPLAITELYKKGILSAMELIAKLSANPAKIAGLKKGTLSEGADADITIIDPDFRHAVNVSNFASKSKNSPFNDREVYGIVKYTIVSGEVIIEQEGS